MGGRSRLARDLHMRNRGNCCQGLATKTMGPHHLKVLQASNLAGGVAHHGERQVVFIDALPIVGNSNSTDTPFFEGNGNTAGLCIDCVLEQFFDHRCRPFNDFASRNLADQRIGQ